MSEEEEKKKPDLVREQPVSYETYAAMPDDGNRYEVVDGKLELMSPGPVFAHQSVSGELEFLLKNSCRSDYVICDAPLDLILSDTDIRQPDLMMIHRSRLSILTRRGVEGAPDLVVEILSPGSRKRDKVGKARTYAKYGVPEYWIVDPDAVTLERYLLQEGKAMFELEDLFEENDTVASDKLPCVSFCVKELFADIPPHLQEK
ncbi:Uma2 family endonuclease [Paenibacillus koleovorans]|uniref:Uma2 family endonuclease n=1 Tax=Paenibacillus koleovorans TaxID=121608 RepID=UPI000FDC1F5B|nr:Uma2 family endonuclease [Paenibacillus koleovorans]